jgi:hypothetical protein
MPGALRTSGTAGAPRAVTLRAVSIGILCAALLCALTPYNDFKVAATFIAGTQFPIGAICVLFFLVAVVNVGLRKFAPKRAFTRGELLTIWSLILVASGLPSSGMMRYLLPLIVAPHYLSNANNNWESKVWGDAPDWLKLRDADAAKAYYTGYPQGQEHIPWAAWTEPLCVWGLLAVLFLLASFSVASLLRRQWVQNERFVFPLVTLPILLAEEPEEPRQLINTLLRRPLLWAAMGGVTVLHSLNGLHQLFPSIPNIPMQWDLNNFFTAPPWNQIGWLPFRIYLLVVGISFLLSTEVCFSIWFFFLFYKFQLLIFAANDWDAPGTDVGYGNTKFHGLEAYGGSLGLLAWTLWAARSHLSDVWQKALNGPRATQIDDSGEMLSYRATLIGIVLSYGGIALWLHVAAVPATLILLALLLMTLVFVIVGWMVCQAGMLMMQTPVGTVDVLANTVGVASLKVSALFTVSRFEGMFLYDTRELLAASVLNSAKAADAGGIKPRSLFKAMALCVFVGLGVSLVAALWLPYYHGGANTLQDTWGSRDYPNKLLTWLAGSASTPHEPTWGNVLHILAGFCGVVGLLILRARAGFGLHPIGFLAASTYAAYMFWASFFIGWLLKSILQRYGGMSGYRMMLPFFLGLILGDALNAMVWVIIGCLTGTGYQIMPG